MSTLVADNIKGRGDAKTIDVFAGHATDSTTTTNLEQGLAKAWLTCIGDNTAVDDSLNISSLTDVTSATGRQNYSSSFNNVHYSFVGQAESTFSTTMVNLFYTHADKTASATQYFTVTSAGANTDTEENCTQVHGDLA